jgi:hypothetical protein
MTRKKLNYDIAPTDKVLISMLETWPWKEKRTESPYSGTAVYMCIRQRGGDGTYSFHLGREDALFVAESALVKAIDDFQNEALEYREKQRRVAVEEKTNGRRRIFRFDNPIEYVCGDGRIHLELHNDRKKLDLWLPAAMVIYMARGALDVVNNKHTDVPNSGTGKL